LPYFLSGILHKRIITNLDYFSAKIQKNIILASFFSKLFFKAGQEWTLNSM